MSNQSSDEKKRAVKTLRSTDAFFANRMKKLQKKRSVLESTLRELNEGTITPFAAMEANNVARW